MPDKTRTNDLPSFAAQWIRQWKEAAPRLQAIRDEELRRLRSPTKRAAEHVIYDRYPERNGMVIMQRWFMRRHLLDQATGIRQLGMRKLPPLPIEKISVHFENLHPSFSDH